MNISKLIKKIKSSSAWLRNTLREATNGEITFKYAAIKIWSQFTLVGKRFLDGVNWSSYNGHYLEELKIAEKTNTLLIKNTEMFIENGMIRASTPNLKPLLVTHHLLYETILKLNPQTVLEVGCGAGDHLANLKILSPNLECYGVDLLQKQLDSLNSRHPRNDFQLNVADVTLVDFLLPKVELLFTHAVLMHITEKEHRFQNTLNNIFMSAQQHIVFMENWTQHNFFVSIERYLVDNSQWKVYFDVSDRDEQIRIMIISKKELPSFEILEDYDDLLLGQPVVFH